MIPALILWLYKKYASRLFNNYKIPYPRTSESKKELRKVVLILIVIGYPFLSNGQDRKLVYQLIHNGNNIGEMQFSQRISGQDLYLQMISEVKTKFIFPIHVQTNDKAHFSDGRLISSDVNRTVNGKEKECRKTRLINNAYEIQTGSEIGRFNKLIDYNMMLLYCSEPINTPQVYSDNFQQFLSIRKLAKHSYRIHLPNGNYNDYHFDNGICRMVIIHQDWYTITMKLV